MSRSAVILLSGGLDSTVCAAWAREQGFGLLALTIDYNQRHRVELQAAARVGEALGLGRHVVLPLDLTRFGGSALTDMGVAVPKDGVGEGIPVTYVPARNTVFLALALAFAESAGARDIVIGVNAVDYSGYPDCRPEFIAAFENLARLATKAGAEGGDFRIHTPLAGLAKAEIVALGSRLGAPLHLSWSCYDPTPVGRPCGQCDSCRLRAAGFAAAGTPDPAILPAEGGEGDHAQHGGGAIPPRHGEAERRSEADRPQAGGGAV